MEHIFEIIPPDASSSSVQKGGDDEPVVKMPEPSDDPDDRYLPETYGANRLVVMQIDLSTIYVYWDLEPSIVDAARDGRIMLSFTSWHFGHPTQETIHVYDVGNWYFIRTGGFDWSEAELFEQLPDGRKRTLIRATDPPPMPWVEAFWRTMTDRLSDEEAERRRRLLEASGVRFVEDPDGQGTIMWMRVSFGSEAYWLARRLEMALPPAGASPAGGMPTASSPLPLRAES